MRAAFYTRQGPAREVLQIGERPTPVPGPGDVRVRLRTSGVNPSDWKARRGGSGRGMVAPLVIPHSDGAGEIDAAGVGVPGSRRRARLGLERPVEAAVRHRRRVHRGAERPGGAPARADRLCGRRLLRHPRPHGRAGRASGASRVAYHGVDRRRRGGGRPVRDPVRQGPRRTRAGYGDGEAKAAAARAAGADAVINYRTEPVGERVAALTDGRGVDVVIEVDLGANAALYPAIVRPRGTVVVYGTSAAEAAIPALWLMQNSVTIRPFLVYDLSPADRAAGINELTRLVEQGRLIHAIGQRLPLDAIAEAHEIVECGSVIGNVVLDIA